MSTGGENIRPVLTYNLNAGASPYYIQKYAENNIAPGLALLEGINEVKVYGAVPFEWEICFDVELVNTLGIKADEIANAINSYFRKEIIGVGSFRLPGQTYEKKMRLVLQTDKPGELSWDKIPVKKAGDRIIYLTDLASIRYKEKFPDSYYRINGLNTINIVIYPEKNMNNIRLAGNVKKEIENIKNNLPEGFSVLLSYDTT